MFTLADPIQLALLAWALAGLVVAALFLLIGVGKIDPAAHNALAFRAVILPGVVLLWPAVLWRWIALSVRKPSHDAIP